MGIESVNYQCPACGGPLRYDGAKALLVCDHCDSEFAVTDIETRYASKQQAAEEKAQKVSVSASSDASGLDGAYVCSSCGAELVCDASTAVSECPYCGNPTVVPGQFSGMLKPDLVIPFKLSREDAIRELKKHYRGKAFLPKTFSSENQLQKIQGIYVPFWLFSGEAEGSSHFECTRSRSYRSGEYRVTETEHYDVYRAGTMPFEKVPVDASSKMPDDHMDSIEPYDYSDLKPFSTAYLPGFLADKYDVSVDECRERADTRCMGSLQTALRNSVKGYETCFPRGKNASIQAGKVHYAMLPVWVLNTKWQDKDFLFAMNGQTGRLVGDLPIDKKKRALIGLGVFAAFFAACFAAVNYGGFLAENEEFIQWGFIILVPLLVMLLVCAVLTAQMRSAVEASEANRYLDNDSIEITHSHDSFDYTTTERIHHESKKD